MESLILFKKWLMEVNEKCQDPDLDYFLEIIEVYQEENKVG